MPAIPGPELTSAADRCPGVLALHPAADGLLARVRLPGGRLTAGGLDAIAAAAGHGNGLIELTSRASVQIRGLSAEAAAACAEVLAAAELLPSIEHERVRNILASPFGGRHPDSLAATDDLVEALDRGLCADPDLAGLPSRFLFSVEDGAGFAGERADVALVATGPDTFRLGRRELSRLDAVAAALDRARELAAGAGPPAAHALPPTEPRTIPLGPVRQADGHVALTVMPPLARLEPLVVHALADLTRQLGTEARISTARTLSLVDLPPATAPGVLARLQTLGLIADPASGWVGLTACAGEGACTKARFDVRAAAAARVPRRGPGSPVEHWAGCERHCGRPPGAMVRSAP